MSTLGMWIFSHASLCDWPCGYNYYGRI